MRCAHSIRRMSPVRLALEHLEGREVPAGNVTADVFHYWWGSYLEVNGDAENNQVVLRGTGNPGEIEITGIGTTINGGTEPLTFSDFLQVNVYGQEGEDTIRALNLDASHVFISGGMGDDTIEMRGFAPATDFSTVWLTGDGDSDDLLFTQATMSGSTLLIIDGDNYEDAPGHNSLTISNVDMNGTMECYTNWYSSNPASPGDDITVQDINWSFSGYAMSFGSWGVIGTSGNDHFRINNLNFSWFTEHEVWADIGFGSYEGNDTLDMTNVNVEAYVSETAGEGFSGPFNQVWMSVFADTVRVSNVDFIAGGHFFNQQGGYTYQTSGFFGISGSVVDARNINFHTNGFGGIGFTSSEIWIDGIIQDESLRFTNIQVSSWDGKNGDFYLDTAGGNDHVHMTNCVTDNLFAYLGEGDDSLWLNNVDVLWTSLLEGGLGSDLIKLQNTSGPIDYFDFETIL